MQSTFVDTTSHLQLCSAKLPGHCVIVQADSKLTGRFAAFMTELLTFFFLVKYGKSSIAYLL